MATDIKLTSSEIACLWSAYMNDTLAKCILGYFLTHVVDEETRPVVQMAYDFATQHTEQSTDMFEAEGLPLPTGFTEEDVNLKAPRLYTDTFMLTYINHMAKVGLIAYSGFISMSARKDIREYFMKGLSGTSELYDRSSDVLIAKGLFVRAPFVSYPKGSDYIDSKKYLSGISIFSKERPLNDIEISYLYMNIQTNLIGTKLSLSFAQTSPRKKVINWMLRGEEIAKKHVSIFSKTLLENHIQAPISSDVAITDSTAPPFSDKLMMYHMSLLSGAGSGNYATAAAASQRTDLIANYQRLTLEIAQYMLDGTDIMIENKWLEDPPGTVDKEMLAKKKNAE